MSPSSLVIAFAALCGILVALSVRGVEGALAGLFAALVLVMVGGPFTARAASR